MIPMDRKTVEWKVAAAETAAREAGYDFPIAWALMFIRDYQGLMTVLLKLHAHPDVIKELEKIVDWIENGDPNERE